jgi:hypothetical protein
MHLLIFQIDLARRLDSVNGQSILRVRRQQTSDSETARGAQLCQELLAHPLKVRAIASARIKNGRIDPTVSFFFNEN